MSPPSIGIESRLKPCPARPRLSRKPTTVPSSSVGKEKSHNPPVSSKAPVECDKKTRKIFLEASHPHREPHFLCLNPPFSPFMPSRFSSPYPGKNSHKPRFPIPYSRNALTATKKEAQRPLLFFLMAKIRQKWRKKKDNNGLVS